MSPSKKNLRRLLVLLVVVIAVAAILFVVYNKPRPTGIAGPDAEAMGRQMLESVNADAWKRTGAVRFTFGGHRHLWDRHRGFDRIEYDKHMVLLRIRNRTGRVWKSGTELDAAQSEGLLQKAYAHWVNDSFWLNPVVKIFDKGVTRSVVLDKKGSAHLLVEYSAGGITPGDAYLWSPGANGAPPTQWRMWTSIMPIHGLSASWEGWTELSTGARVATQHRFGPINLKLKDVAGAKSLMELPGISQDPFLPLLQ